MGLSSKKTSSTSTTNQNTTMNTTPVNPGWVTDSISGLSGKIGDYFNNLDPNSLVAGPHVLQTDAAMTAGGLSGSPWNLNQSADTMRGLTTAGANTYAPTTGNAATGNAVTGNAVTGNAVTGNAASVLDNLQSYFSPYQNNVIDSALRDYNYGAGQTQAQNQLALAGDSTFGGSGGAIQTALSNDAIDRGRGALSANLYDQGFQRATGLSEADAGRRQQMTLANMGAQNQFGLTNLGAQNQFGLANLGAQNQFGLANTDAQNRFGLANMDAFNNAGQFNASAADRANATRLAGAQGLADLSFNNDANTRANAGLQFDIGTGLHGIDQQRAGADLAALTAQTGLLGSLPYDLFKGSNSTGSMTGTTNTTGKESGASLGDWLSYFASNARAAATGGG
jgi:hypothetical protein